MTLRELEAKLGKYPEDNEVRIMLKSPLGLYYSATIEVQSTGDRVILYAEAEK